MTRNRLEFKVVVNDDASHQLQNVAKEVDGISVSLKRLATQAISVATIIQVAKLADTYRLLQNRLRLVTANTEELKTVTDELQRVSVRTRASFQSTADLYARVARSSRELGLSQQELINFTETVQKSIRISGSTAQEAAAGVIQFGQALASSRLSGDELRSVLEQMPRLAQAIAEGMGVGIGRLRELGESGALSATAVLEALRKAAPEIADEFEQLKPLVSDAFIVLQSSFLASIGTIDEVAGSSEALADIILELAGQVELLGDALTGQLTEGKLEALADESKLLATALLGVAFALGAVKDGLDLSLGTPIEFFRNITSRLLEAQGSVLKPESITDAFRIAWEDTMNTTIDDARDTQETLIEDFDEMMRRIGNIFGDNVFVPPIVDLTGAEGASIITPAQQKIINDAAAKIEKFQEALFNQAAALQLARTEGIDYAQALQMVKITAAGAAAGQQEYAANLNETFKALQAIAEEDKANRSLERIQNDLIDQGQAFEIASRQGIDYSVALEIVQLRALGAAAGNEELAENLVQVQLKFAEMKEELENQSKFMEQLSTQAARNIQSAFADFLFDPFEDGIKGMLKSFIDALRRMLAEALAFQILTNIPGLGNFFGGGGSSVFARAATAAAATAAPSASGSGTFLGLPTGGGRAEGGVVTAGVPVLVGERGAEVFVPGASGDVFNKSASAFSRGEVSFVTNIDARGADPGLIARLPGIMEQRDKRLMLKVKQFIETGSALL